MIGNKTVTCIIPARLASSRFPKKMLALLRDKPLVQWVWEAASTVRCFDTVAVATDHEEIAQCVKNFGGTVFMTSPDCLNGTERLSELQQKGVLQGDIWVCWQGDEPFITEKTIAELLQTAALDGRDVWTLKKRITDPEEIGSPHVVQVVCNLQGDALYFSRYPIPYYRDHTPEEEKQYYKHIGIYAYSNEALKKIAALAPTPLEQAEKLEQLRFLENNLRVRVHETDYSGIGIDLPEHLALAHSLIL